MLLTDCVISVCIFKHLYHQFRLPGIPKVKQEDGILKPINVIDNNKCVCFFLFWNNKFFNRFLNEFLPLTDKKI